MNKIIQDILNHLCKEIGARAPGTIQEEKAATYLKDYFTNLGLKTQIEHFDAPSHKAKNSDILILNADSRFSSFPVLFSPGGKVEGKLIHIGPEELKRGSFNGLIGIWVADKNTPQERNSQVMELEKKGLEGLILITPDYYRIDTKVVGNPNLKKMPVVSVSFKTGSELIKNIGKTANIIVETESGLKEESSNIVAKIPGTSKNWLFIGAHYDTVPFTQGALNNASGVSVLLGVAEILKKEKLPADIYLVAFGSKENDGLDGIGRGSSDFLNRRTALLNKCLGYINIDTIGSRLSSPRVYIGGPAKFKKTILETETSINYSYEGKYPNITLDFGASEKNGIPYATFSDFVIPYYNSPEDTLENIDLERLVTYSKDISNIAKSLSKKEPPYPIVTQDDITIRQATYKDIERICEITAVAYIICSGSKLEQEFFGEKLGGKNWDEYKKRELINACNRNIYNIIVSEKDNQVVGYATWNANEEIGIAYIGNNAVDPKHQGKGIGTFMQREIHRRMVEAGYKRFGVCTLSNDIPAQKLYKKLGFTVNISTIHYLKKGD